MMVPKGFIPDTDNDNFTVQRRGRAGHFVLQDGEVSEAGVDDRGAGSRRRDASIRAPAAAVRAARRQPGRMMVNTEAAPAAQWPRWPTSSTGCGPKLSNIPGLHVFLTVPQAIRVGGRMSKSSLRFHAVRTRHGAALHRGAETGASDRQAAGPAGRHHRSADQESAREYRARPRPRGRAAA